MVQVRETMRFSCSPSRYHITAQTLQRYICTWRGTARHMLTSLMSRILTSERYFMSRVLALERYFMSKCWHQRDTWCPDIREISTRVCVPVLHLYLSRQTLNMIHLPHYIVHSILYYTLCILCYIILYIVHCVTLYYILSIH